LLRDLIVGVVMAVASWYFFYVGLGVPLAPGILDGIL
jgi:putative tricarboxylic transport membrane protein